MKLTIILFLLSMVFLSFQKMDSVLYPDPTKVPDTQRTPPTKIHKEDTAQIKMKGGALIDTITPHRNKKDSL